MLVFISWSGERSKKVAEFLETWLKQVIQNVDPWISSDISKGARWNTEIANKLENSKVGIMCLTPENLDSNWILFEAGALSKTKDAHVCTFLIGVEPTEIQHPLAQFQHTTINKDDVLKLIYAINNNLKSVGSKPLESRILDDVFNAFWPKLEKVLIDATKDKSIPIKPTRTEREMLEEVLMLSRNHENILSSMRSELSTGKFVDKILQSSSKSVDINEWVKSYLVEKEKQDNMNMLIDLLSNVKSTDKGKDSKTK